MPAGWSAQSNSLSP